MYVIDELEMKMKTVPFIEVRKYDCGSIENPMSSFILAFLLIFASIIPKILEPSVCRHIN